MAKVVELVDGKFASRTLNSGVNASTVIAALSTAAGPVGLNGQKLTDVAPGTVVTDGVTVGQLPKTVLNFWPSYAGVPTQPNTFKTWPAVMAARLAFDGPVTINVVGTTVADPGVIDPDVGNAHWPMAGVSIEAPVNVPGFAAFDALQGVAGGHLRFTDLACFDDLAFARGICFQSRSSSHIFDNAASAHYDTICSLNAESCTFQLDNDIVQGGTGTAPLFPTDKAFVAAFTNGCAFSKTDPTATTDCVVRFCAPMIIPGTSITASGLIVASGIFIPGQYTMNGWPVASNTPSAIVYVATDAVSGFTALRQENFYPFGTAKPTPQQMGYFDFSLCSQIMTVLASYTTQSLQGTEVVVTAPTSGQVLTGHQPATPGAAIQWKAEDPNRDAVSLQGTAIGATGPTLNQVLKGVDIGGGTINWAPGDAPAGGVVSVSGTEPIEVTGGTGTTPIIGISSTPTFEALTAAASAGQFTLSPAPLAYGRHDYSNAFGPLPGILYLTNNTAFAPNSILQGQTAVMLNATGIASTGDWRVACCSTDMGGTVYFSLYFPIGYFADAAALIAWFFAQTSAVITVDLWAVAFTANGPTLPYTWATPGTLVTGFADPPTFTYALPTYAHIDSTECQLGVPLLVRHVIDYQMFATAGTESEIVYNTSDRKLYQCLNTADPAQWHSLSEDSPAFIYAECGAASIEAGYAVGIAISDGAPKAFLVDIAQNDVGAGSTPFVVGVATAYSTVGNMMLIRASGPAIVDDGVFVGTAPTNATADKTVYASATPGKLTLDEPTATSRWIAPVGLLYAHDDTHSTSTILVGKCDDPVWTSPATLTLGSGVPVNDVDSSGYLRTIQSIPVDMTGATAGQALGIVDVLGTPTIKAVASGGEWPTIDANHTHYYKFQEISGSTFVDEINSNVDPLTMSTPGDWRLQASGLFTHGTKHARLTPSSANSVADRILAVPVAPATPTTHEWTLELFCRMGMYGRPDVPATTWQGDYQSPMQWITNDLGVGAGLVAILMGSNRWTFHSASGHENDDCYSATITGGNGLPGIGDLVYICVVGHGCTSPSPYHMDFYLNCRWIASMVLHDTSGVIGPTTIAVGSAWAATVLDVGYFATSNIARSMNYMEGVYNSLRQL